MASPRLEDLDSECGVIEESKWVCASTIRLKTGAALGVTLRVRLGRAISLELGDDSSSFESSGGSRWGNLLSVSVLR
jgi:hypothetical protein